MAQEKTHTSSDFIHHWSGIDLMKQAQERRNEKPQGAKVVDRSGSPPLYIDQNHSAAPYITIRFQGVVDAGGWVEVDVLGCWGVRVARDPYGCAMKDSDGCYMFERVYGKFEIVWDLGV